MSTKTSKIRGDSSLSLPRQGKHTLYQELESDQYKIVSVLTSDATVMLSIYSLIHTEVHT